MKISKLIYVDDDIEDLDIFAEAVNDIRGEATGKIELTVLNSAVQLIPVLRGTEIDDCFLFLDINMPVKNGFDILKDLREHPEFKALAVFTYSTASDPRTVKTSFDLGASLHIIKPGTLPELKQIIKTVLSGAWKNRSQNLYDFVLNVSKKSNGGS